MTKPDELTTAMIRALIRVCIHDSTNPRDLALADEATRIIQSRAAALNTARAIRYGGVNEPRRPH